jgi:hypothetical protein
MFLIDIANLEKYPLSRRATAAWATTHGLKVIFYRNIHA